MINTLALVPLLLTSQGLSEGKIQEMRQVLEALAKLSQSTMLDRILSDLRSPENRPLQDGLNKEFWALWAGMSRVSYTARGGFRGYSAQGVPTAARPTRTDEDLIDEAGIAVGAIRHWDYPTAFTVKRDGLDLRVLVRPVIDGVKGNHGGTITFDRHSGLLKNIILFDRLDYAKYRSANRVTPEAARESAITAYARYMPFTATEIGGPNLWFGAPLGIQRSDPHLHEISPEEMAEFRNFVAMPLYYVHFRNVGEPSGVAGQTVIVNAMTGRALVLNLESFRSNTTGLAVSTPPRWKAATSYAFQDAKGKQVGTAKRGATGTAQGDVITLASDGKVLSMRYDRGAKRLYLTEAGKAVIYTPDAALQKHLASLPKPGKKFGS